MNADARRCSVRLIGVYRRFPTLGGMRSLAINIEGFSQLVSPLRRPRLSVRIAPLFGPAKTVECAGGAHVQPSIRYGRRRENFVVESIDRKHLPIACRLHHGDR